MEKRILKPIVVNHKSIFNFKLIFEVFESDYVFETNTTFHSDPNINRLLSTTFFFKLADIKKTKLDIPLCGTIIRSD